MQDLNALAAEIHAANSHWWHDPATGQRLDRNKGELLMLVVSELSEAMEGERKDLMDDHLPHRKMAEVELADVLIRIFDFAGGFGYALHYPTGFLGRLPENKGDALFAIVQAVTHAGEWLRCGASVNAAESLSEAIHYVLRYAKKHGYDVWGAMAEKRAYNATRADHKAEARLAANGKKW